jgi:hypothetical protein
LAGQTYRFGESRPQSDAFFYVNIADRDGSMGRDKLLDHLDGILIALTGAASHDALSTSGRSVHELMRGFTQRTCLNQTTDPFSVCASTVVHCASAEATPADAERAANEIWDRYYYSEPEHRWVRDQCAAVQERVSRALAAYESSPSYATLDGEARGVALLAAKRLLAAYSVPEDGVFSEDGYQDGAFDADSMEARVDLQLNDAALSYLAKEVTGQEFRSALEAYVRIAGTSRTNPGPVVEQSRDVLEQIEGDWEAFTREFRRYERQEGVDVAGLGVIGDRGFLVQIYDPETNRQEDGTDADVGPYSRILLESFARRRARLITSHWDKLLSRIGGSIFGGLFGTDPGLDTYRVRADEALAYTLVSLLPPELRDMHIDIRQNDVGWLGQPWRDYYNAAGYGPLQHHLVGEGATERFDVGSFSLDALITTSLEQ